MTNLEKYNKIFMGVFRKKEEELKELKYRGLTSGIQSTIWIW